MSEEVVTDSWFSRISNSIKGIFFGFLLVIGSIVLLAWNEKRCVDRYNTIDFAKNNYVSTVADSVETDKEGKLVHFNGSAKTSDVLTDSEFGVSVDNSFSLTRKVEMYQWQQEQHSHKKKNAGGSTTTTYTYTYKKVWSSEPIDSNGFKEAGHDNPAVFPFKSNKVFAENVTLGAHRIPSEKISGLGSAVEVELDAEKIVKPISAVVKGNTILFNVLKEEKAKLINTNVEQTSDVNMAQFMPSEAAPTIGDIRITFTKNPVGDVTVLAQQAGNSIKAFKTQSGDFYEVRNGLMSPEDVFKATEEENLFLTWFLRGLGFILMALGFGTIFRPLSVLADVLPLLGDIAETGIFIISVLISAVLSLATIAISWLICRPVLAVTLFVLIGAGIVGIVSLISKAKSAKTARNRESASEAVFSAD